MLTRSELLAFALRLSRGGAMLAGVLTVAVMLPYAIGRLIPGDGSKLDASFHCVWERGFLVGIAAAIFFWLCWALGGLIP